MQINREIGNRKEKQKIKFRGIIAALFITILTTLLFLNL